MKLLSRSLLPAAVLAVAAVIVYLDHIEVLPYELIPGIPFDLSLLPMMVIFWLTYFILDKNVLEPLYLVMEQREEKIAEADQTLESARREFDQVCEEWENRMRRIREEIREKREEIRTSLYEKRARAVAEAKREAERKTREALAEIRKNKEEAQRALQAYAQKLSVTLAEKVLGRKCA